MDSHTLNFTSPILQTGNPTKYSILINPHFQCKLTAFPGMT
jgi:hypothetical protein